MDIKVVQYEESKLDDIIRIWDEVVLAGNAFPQEKPFTREEYVDYFASQSYTGMAVDENGRVCGMYILHPNNIGRCGHICNASYAVDGTMRGLHIGEAIVKDCMKQAARLGFRVLQFNAVVESNTRARHLYEKLGFIQLGTIRGGFRMNDGTYENICPYYIELTEKD